MSRFKIRRSIIFPSLLTFLVLSLTSALIIIPELTPISTHAAPLADAPLQPDDPALTFIAFDPNTDAVELGSLANAGTVYEQYLTVTTRTNSPQGYSLYLTMADSNTCLRHEDYIDTLDYEDSTPCTSVPGDHQFTAGNPNDSLTTNTWGYSVNGGVSFITPMPEGPSTAIKSTNSKTGPSGDPTTITFGAKRGNPQYDPLANGEYSGQLILTAMANKPTAPSISSVSPASGANAMPGATITITGTNLGTAFSVDIGGNECTSVNIVSNTQITCVIPIGTPGAAVDVVVTTWGGTATRPFTYSAAPTFTSMTPNAYPTRRSDTLAKLTPGVAIATGGGSVIYTTAVWFDLDADGQRATDGTEDCTSFTAAASSIACTAPPVLDIDVTTTKAYTVCFTVFGIAAPVCGANAFTYYYDTTPPVLSIHDTSTSVTNGNAHSSPVDIPISMTGSGNIDIAIPIVNSP
jgi:hypothetical protein